MLMTFISLLFQILSSPVRFLLSSVEVSQSKLVISMVSSSQMLDRFWSLVPRSGCFELCSGSGKSVKLGIYIFSMVALIFLWSAAQQLNHKSEEWMEMVSCAFMLIFYMSALLTIPAIVKNKKALLIPALVWFPLTSLFSSAFFFAGIYFQTKW